jgi:hypothetical protein
MHFPLDTCTLGSYERDKLARRVEAKKLASVTTMGALEEAGRASGATGYLTRGRPVFAIAAGA